MIAAHRGGAGLGPENQLPTFALSHALGVRTLETDVRATADGVALAFHDADLDRTTSLTGPVRERTAADLAGQVLPMHDLLAAFDDVELLIDVKEARAVEPLARAIHATGSADRVWVAGGWDPWLAGVADLCPGVRVSLGWRGLSALMWSARCGRRAPDRLGAVAAAAHVPWRLGGVGWLSSERITTRLLEQCDRLGLVLRAWTVDAPEDLARLVRLGVPTVITDRPDVAREVLIRLDRWHRPDRSVQTRDAGVVEPQSDPRPDAGNLAAEVPDGIQHRARVQSHPQAHHVGGLRGRDDRPAEVP